MEKQEIQQEKVFFCKTAFQLVRQHVLLPGAVPLQVQNMALALVKFHVFGDCPRLKFVKIPLQGLTTLMGVNNSF